MARVRKALEKGIAMAILSALHDRWQRVVGPEWIMRGALRSADVRRDLLAALKSP